MTDAPSNPSDREQRLQDVLAGFMQAVEAGQTPDRQKLLAEHPDLADELASFFANREEFARLAVPVRAARIRIGDGRRRTARRTACRASATTCGTSAITKSSRRSPAAAWASCSRHGRSVSIASWR